MLIMTNLVFYQFDFTVFYFCSTNNVICRPTINLFLDQSDLVESLYLR